jgi:hypothetical protein
VPLPGLRGAPDAGRGRPGSRGRGFGPGWDRRQRPFILPLRREGADRREGEREARDDERIADEPSPPVDDAEAREQEVGAGREREIEESDDGGADPHVALDGGLRLDRDLRRRLP